MRVHDALRVCGKKKKIRAPFIGRLLLLCKHTEVYRISSIGVQMNVY